MASGKAKPDQAKSGKAEKTNNKSIAALVLGIGGLIIPFIAPILAILAVVFGVLGLKEVKASGEKGHGMALAGIIMGGAGILFALLMLIGGMAYFL